MNGGQRVVLGGLAAILVLATVRQVVTKPGLPPPGIYFGAGAWFSAWYVVASFAPSFAGVVAAGTVVSALLAPYVEGGSGSSPITQLAGLISQISGGIAPASQSAPQAAATQGAGRSLVS